MAYNKKTFIEKYGEEAWKEERLKRNKRNREYDAKNKDKKKARQARYEEKHKDEIRERSAEYRKNNKEKEQARHKKYREENHDKIKERRKHYHEEHKDEINAKQAIYREENRDILKERQIAFYEKYPDKKSEYGKKYYGTHQEQIKAYRIEYSGTKERRASSIRYQYQKKDRDNNREGFNLTQRWILDNIFNSKCIYCGDDDWHHLGCDRIDDEKAHTTDNCVCACALCNVERFYKGMSVEEFIEYRKIVPLGGKLPKLENVVEINGKKVIKKVG